MSKRKELFTATRSPHLGVTPRVPVRTFRWRTALDNHEPTRGFVTGEGLRYAATDVLPETITLNVEGITDPYRSHYLVDNGHTVTAWYVAGYKMTDPAQVHLHPFPTGDNHDQTLMGPRRTYHLKVTKIRKIGGAK